MLYCFHLQKFKEEQTQLCDDKCQNEVKTGIDLEQKATECWKHSAC